jgi:hypothetical protein
LVAVDTDRMLRETPSVTSSTTRRAGHGPIVTLGTLWTAGCAPGSARRRWLDDLATSSVGPRCRTAPWSRPACPVGPTGTHRADPRSGPWAGLAPHEPGSLRAGRRGPGRPRAADPRAVDATRRWRRGVGMGRLPAARGRVLRRRGTGRAHPVPGAARHRRHHASQRRIRAHPPRPAHPWGRGRPPRHQDDARGALALRRHADRRSP